MHTNFSVIFKEKNILLKKCKFLYPLLPFVMHKLDMYMKQMGVNIPSFSQFLKNWIYQVFNEVVNACLSASKD